jgi:hypothetical protein
MTQRQIDAAYRRSLKTVYKHLTRPQYQLVKLMEQIEQNNKECVGIERRLQTRYGEGWRKSEHAQRFMDYDIYMQMQADNITLSEKVSRLETKYSLDRDEVMAFHNKMNQAHSASMVGASAY